MQPLYSYDSKQPKNAQPRHAAKKRRKFRRRRGSATGPDYAIAVFTFFLVLVSFLQSCSLIDANRIAKRSANAAKTSAKAAQDAVKVAEDIAHSQQRAYVLVSQGRVVGLDGDGPTIRVVLTVKNFGLTPAHNIEIIPLIECRRKPRGETNVSAPTTKDIPVLAGGEKLDFEEEIPVTPEDRKLLRSGDESIYASGYVPFRDIFGEWHESDGPFGFIQGRPFKLTDPLMGVDPNPELPSKPSAPTKFKANKLAPAPLPPAMPD